MNSVGMLYSYLMDDVIDDAFSRKKIVNLLKPRMKADSSGSQLRRQIIDPEIPW